MPRGHDATCVSADHVQSKHATIERTATFANRRALRPLASMSWQITQVAPLAPSPSPEAGEPSLKEHSVGLTPAKIHFASEAVF
eukprot:163311-Prymnesium_polylepis.1